MQALKKLVSETAIYGLTSIVGRVLFFLLTPIYTNKAVLEQSEYGELTHLFSISAFLLVLFGYGLETAFFRYSLNEKNNLKQTYSTALTSIFWSTIAFGGILLLLHKQLALILDASSYQHLVLFVIIIVMLDSLTSIPFAYLRATNRPIKFASIKLLGIGVNLGLNLFFYVACPAIIENKGFLYEFVSSWYNPRFGVGYALIANLVDAGLKLILLSKDYFTYQGFFDKSLWKKMLKYGWPIMIVSFAGIINEVGDRQLLKWFLPGDEEERKVQLAIYGACYKLSIFLSLFTQAFRYAGEPFFFAQAKEKDARKTYALVLKYFTLVSLIGFLIISLYIDIFKFFITDPSYWVGLKIVPILLMAYVLYGMYYNMSVWYKLSDKTKLGGVVAIVGALVTIIVNIVFIPQFGYMASAWATLLCFLIMVIISKFWGQIHYPVPYEWPNILSYFMFSLIIFYIVKHFQIETENINMQNIFYATLGLVLFMLIIFLKEKNQIKSLVRA